MVKVVLIMKLGSEKRELANKIGESNYEGV